LPRRFTTVTFRVIRPVRFRRIIQRFSNPHTYDDLQIDQKENIRSILKAMLCMVDGYSENIASGYRLRADALYEARQRVLCRKQTFRAI